MDPQAAMMNGGGGSFQADSNVSYNLVEIWPYLINAPAGAAQCGLGTSPNVNGVSRDHDVQVSDPMALDLRGDQNGCGARKRREDHESVMEVSTSGNGTSENSSKRQKTTRLNENCEFKADSEGNPGKPAEQAAKPAEPPKDFIHVRARRGQATDSHSLAERARREKISERMRILQDLVPGCNKVIGKALVLDEIINYIQSLQRQVEFLSMKLEVVTSRTSTNIEEFRPKDFLPQPFDPSSIAFGPQATREYQHRISSDWLHMQIGGGLERTT